MRDPKHPVRPFTSLKLLVAILAIMTLVSCEKKAGFSMTEETESILNLHHLQREYHFNKDSIAFANLFSEQFTSVNRGQISHPTREETQSRYHRYFSSVEFITWDDVSAPIIRFSDDGSMAYTVVDKLVVVSFENEDGLPEEGSTHFAWTTIYRKHDGEWKIDCVISTERPAEPG